MRRHRAASRSSLTALTRAITCQNDFNDFKGDLLQNHEFVLYPPEPNANPIPATWDANGGPKFNDGVGKMLVNNMILWAGSNVQSSYRSILSMFLDSEQTAGRNCRILVAHPKAPDTSYQKCKREYNSDPRRLVDAIRGTVVYSTVAHMEAGVCAFYRFIHDNFTGGVGKYRFCKVAKQKDRWTPPANPPPDDSGYRDFMLTLECTWAAREYYTEVQFHVCPMLQAKQGKLDVLKVQLGDNTLDMNGHQIYEAYRVMSATDKAGPKGLALMAKSRALYALAMQSTKCNLDDAPKFETAEAHPDDTVEVVEKNLKDGVVVAKKY